MSELERCPACGNNVHIDGGDEWTTEPTYELLERQRSYAGKERLSVKEQGELSYINSKLERLGFRFFHTDEEYSRYLRLRNEKMQARFGTDDPEELAGHSIKMTLEQREELSKRLIQELLSEQYPVQESERRVSDASRKLVWTTETPTIEGFYWLQWGYPIFKPRVVEVSIIRNELHALFCGNECEEPLPISGTRWAGPIPKPQEPRP